MGLINWIKSYFEKPPLPPPPVVPKPVAPQPNPDRPIATEPAPSTLKPIGQRPMIRADESKLSLIDRKHKKGTVQWYQAAYLIIEFDRGYENQIRAAAARVLKGKANYLDIERATKIPWYVIGLIHNMECNNDFRGVLHNGERIVGTGKKTKLVPKGRGPFKTWREAALDAILTQAMWAQKSWDVGSVLKVCEAFNGLGYLKYHPLENSPYLWACSSINDGNGKYIADGKWSPTAPTNLQVGVATILRRLELDQEVNIQWA